ncbi:unnamed protein product [Prorocentrum cordatum]|uniref:Calcineurin-like phosphoesterase domain-containing protein n=1 Tax=Prorocentrum cordatum TaxID=2364126 RepID=A0ABN9SDW1_9DINO|nr:unnamed protein product [Polarella glacialis]
MLCPGPDDRGEAIAAVRQATEQLQEPVGQCPPALLGRVCGGGGERLFELEGAVSRESSQRLDAHAATEAQTGRLARALESAQGAWRRESSKLAGELRDMGNKLDATAEGSAQRWEQRFAGAAHGIGQRLEALEEQVAAARTNDSRAEDRLSALARAQDGALQDRGQPPPHRCTQRQHLGSPHLYIARAVFKSMFDSEKLKQKENQTYQAMVLFFGKLLLCSSAAELGLVIRHSACKKCYTDDYTRMQFMIAGDISVPTASGASDTATVRTLSNTEMEQVIIKAVQTEGGKFKFGTAPQGHLESLAQRLSVKTERGRGKGKRGKRGRSSIPLLLVWFVRLEASEVDLYRMAAAKQTALVIKLEAELERAVAAAREEASRADDLEKNKFNPAELQQPKRAGGHPGNHSAAGPSHGGRAPYRLPPPRKRVLALLVPTAMLAWQAVAFVYVGYVEIQLHGFEDDTSVGQLVHCTGPEVAATTGVGRHGSRFFRVCLPPLSSSRNRSKAPGRCLRLHEDCTAVGRAGLTFHRLSEAASLLSADGERAAVRRGAAWRGAAAAAVCGACMVAASGLAAGARRGRAGAAGRSAAAGTVGLAEEQQQQQENGAGSGGRLGSFLVIGDWGWDDNVHGNTYSSDCQKQIADLMAEEMERLGDVKFIINVGDSFYPNGVTSKDDPAWETKWRARYSEELRSVPWYSVYGNHDYQHDPCACGDGPADCAQVNDDIDDLRGTVADMPGNSWFKEHPEMDLEVVALDMNHLMWAWDKNASPHEQCPLDCFYSPCQKKCEANLKARSDEGFELFYSRISESTAKNMVVFTHYPTDYFWKYPDFLGALRNGSKRHLEFFGGHRHNVDQDSTTSIEPNSNWLVGGGGGWGCDGEQQGIVVGELRKGKKLATRAVLLDDPSSCCGPPQAGRRGRCASASSCSAPAPAASPGAGVRASLGRSVRCRIMNAICDPFSSGSVRLWEAVPDRGNLFNSHCQRAIATAMLDKMQELGDVKFIINVGDSFYPHGVESRSDPQWDKHWRNRYAPELRSVPWYTTYGNHDYQHDPSLRLGNLRPPKSVPARSGLGTGQGSTCEEHPELGLEVVSLDLNLYMVGTFIALGMFVDSEDAWKRDQDPYPADCQWTPCKERQGNLMLAGSVDGRLSPEAAEGIKAKEAVDHHDALRQKLDSQRPCVAEIVRSLKVCSILDGSCSEIPVSFEGPVSTEAIQLFKARSQAAIDWSFVLLFRSQLCGGSVPMRDSKDYLWPSEDLMGSLKSSKGASGGHRHNVDQDSCASIAPNNQWLVGGGGGWGTDGDQQGFVVGEISDDFTIKTYPVLMDMPCGEGNIQFK